MIVEVEPCSVSTGMLRGRDGSSSEETPDQPGEIGSNQGRCHKRDALTACQLSLGVDGKRWYLIQRGLSYRYPPKNHTGDGAWQEGEKGLER